MLDRRRFLGAVGSIGVASLLDLGPLDVLAAGAQRRGGMFRHGVASGDPTGDSVTIWTRAEPGDPGASRILTWAVYEDAGESEGRQRGSPVASGAVVASPDRDHTVAVRVEGLRANTRYRYRFAEPSRSAMAVEEIWGRTKTVAAAGVGLDRFRIGVVSCGRYTSGTFAAYRALAEEDVDVVLHLGDAIYEDGYGGTIGRPHDPPVDASTLDHYRSRYAQYRADADLQALLAAHPVIAIWDDHEFVGNSWRDGAPGHDPSLHGPWSDRVAAAVRAWSEWTPAERPDPADPNRIWRRLRIGDLIELFCLDTRLVGRDRQAGDSGTITDPARQLLGPRQEQWLIDGLRGSTARWQVLGNQVMLSPLVVPAPAGVIAHKLVASGMVDIDGAAINPDQWDGYPAARRRALAPVVERGAGAGGLVALTGDIHSSWAIALRAGRDPSDAIIGTELVTPAVSSPSFAQAFGGGDGSVPAARLLAAGVRTLDPHLRFVDLDARGYTVVTLRRDDLEATWYSVDTSVTSSDTRARALATVTRSRLDPSDLAVTGVEPRPDPVSDPAPVREPFRGSRVGKSTGGSGPAGTLEPGTIAAGATAAIGALAVGGATIARRVRTSQGTDREKPPSDTIRPHDPLR